MDNTTTFTPGSNWDFDFNSTNKENNIVDFAREKMSQASLTTDPWDYLYVENFLPEEFYNKFDKETMSLLNHDKIQNNARRRVCIYDTRNSDKDVSMETNTRKNWLNKDWPSTRRTDTAENAMPYSHKFCKIFEDKVFRDILLAKFKNSGRCGDRPQPKITGTYATYDVQTPPFKYKVHGEAGQKILSILVYLATKGDDESLGTRIYPGHTVPDRLDFDKDCVKIIPYRPNSIFLFSRTNDIWHDSDGVKHRKISNHAMQNNSTKTRLRRSIQLFYMEDLSAEERSKIYNTGGVITPSAAHS